MLISPDATAILFGLASALSWGAGDFSGGFATKRANVFWVVALSHAAGLLLLIILALVASEPLPPIPDLLWGIVAGLVGAIGLAALYRALALGRMGIAAPVAAVVTAALPVLFGIFSQGTPGTLKLVGFGLALIGVWFVSRSEGSAAAPTGLALALLAGTGFGAFLILIGQVGSNTVYWPLAAARVTSLSVTLVIALRSRPTSLPEGKVLLPVLLAGILDVGGNTFFVLAEQAGRLDIAAVLSSLYPLSTTLLARLILKEHLTRIQAVGTVAALTAIILIAR